MAGAATRKGTLKYGLKVGDQVHKEFELRQATTGDYFDAEAVVGPQVATGGGIRMQAALITQQLVRIGKFEGPFTLELIGKLAPADFSALSAAREELELSGEGWQHG